MTSRIEVIGLCVFCLISAVSFLSFRWPVNQGSITSTFCESRWDHFHDGIDMVSQESNVYPVQEGTLFFYWDKSIFPLDNYPGGGNYKILKHRGGLYSIYMHLEDGVSSQATYTPARPVGVMGNTGHSIKKHIHFSLIDIRKRSSINPCKILPPLPDTRPPEIKEIAFKIGEKYVIVRERANIRLTKHYPLLIRITDSVTGRENLGVYRLSVIFNGKQVLQYECDSIAFSKGKLNINGREFNDLFEKKGYYKVAGLVYVEGDNILKVTASDYSGNQTVREFTFNVKLDMKM